LRTFLGIRGREELYLSFREGLKRAASRLNVNLTEEQEGRLLYYLTREARHSVIEPFMLDENVKDVKVVGLNVLVIHKGYDFLGWLKTNAAFTDAKHVEELVARLVEKRPTNPSAES
jgi:type IV secretory pathway ATPase VirB11/archaellum biosynthesis ATPase